MNESRIDEQPMSGDQREDAMLAAARTFNLVKDLLESLISQVMEKCENGIKNGKGVFSEGQRMILRKAFSESPRITGASLDRLLSRLGGCSRVQVQHWFANRRKIEELRKEEARLAATTWPFYKLNNATSLEVLHDEGNPASRKALKVSGMTEENETCTQSGAVLLTELEENLKEAEKMALDTVTSRPIQLFGASLSLGEAMYCAKKLLEKGWDLGSKAAVLLAFTDQVRFSFLIGFCEA